MARSAIWRYARSQSRVSMLRTPHASIHQSAAAGDFVHFPFTRPRRQATEMNLAHVLTSVAGHLAELDVVGAHVAKLWAQAGLDSLNVSIEDGQHYFHDSV